MRSKLLIVTAGILLAAGLSAGTAALAQQPDAADDDTVSALVARLDLEQYKATLKGLTQFGDRRQGTQRNRDAIDWIEAQLQAVGCTTTERLDYVHDPPPRRGGGRRRRGGELNPSGGTPTGGRIGRNGSGPGGSSIFGYRGRTGMNNDPMAQPDERLRELNREPATNGPRQEVYCTKVGATRPDEMYILGAHMDGHGWGEAANDDGSGTALVMELARVFNAPDVETERSIRFILWNNEETGLNGSRAYVEQRQALQGRADPPGSRRYPEPRWLGMVQHDMMLFDHGAPRPDGTVSRDQRPEADVNIEFQSTADLAEEARQLAFFFKAANDQYATDYPATVGPHMTNTDSTPFMNIVPAISLRENERGAHIGGGWDPHWHQPTDLYTTFTDDDFRLGLNAAQTTLAAIAQLTEATIGRRPRTNADNARYREVPQWPTPVRTAAGTPGPWNFGQVAAVATDQRGQILVLHRGVHPIMEFDSSGQFLRSWGDGMISEGKVGRIAPGDRVPGGSGYTAVYGPAGCYSCGAHSVRVDPQGNIWVVDAGGHLVYKMDAEGHVLMQLGTKGISGAGPNTFNLPTDVAFAPNGDLYVSDGYGNARVVKYSPEGRYLLEWGTRGTGPGEFGLPHNLVVDAQGRVYVTDRDNQRIQVFDATGTFLDEWADIGGISTLFMTEDQHIWAGGVLRNLNGDAQARLPGGAGGHGTTTESGDVYVAQLSGRVQKFVTQ